MVNWAKQKAHATMLLACVFCLMVGCATAIIIGRTAPADYWIIFGGNTDKGNGQGGGMARDQMVAGGWVSYENSFQVTWNADIAAGTVDQTNAAMPAGKDAVSKLCAGRRCIIAGFSLGSSPAIQLAAELGIPADQLWLFGAPQPSTGVWHQQYQDNPFVQPWIQNVGKLNPDQLPPAGSHHVYHARDPYGNAAPQCSGPGLFALTLAEHRILSPGEASHVWTGPDGVINHEGGYTGPIGLPASGADPSQPWAGCLFNDWKSTPSSPGDQTTEGGLPSGGNGPSLPSLPVNPPFPTPGG
ncbi:gp45 [Mycobacterium phage Barnyard]|uniref:PE-PPE domain-containing protein n=1 Tax=Mycobacterium phage Barnyard TaxID=205880 RepID=Q856C7_9CAUD|nr:gp45 [Mycobacterium phage Barnyard]AAN02099.1 hypothetical protein PBI_BARNYARD_45 [Mycobacterium phage Barnyard]